MTDREELRDRLDALEGEFSTTDTDDRETLTDDECEYLRELLEDDPDRGDPRDRRLLDEPETPMFVFYSIIMDVEPAT